VNNLFPHQTERCGIQDEKTSELRWLFFQWCGREDSNLHELPH
jgi:hypothetical protein